MSNDGMVYHMYIEYVSVCFFLFVSINSQQMSARLVHRCIDMLELEFRDKVRNNPYLWHLPDNKRWNGWVWTVFVRRRRVSSNARQGDVYSCTIVYEFRYNGHYRSFYSRKQAIEFMLTSPVYAASVRG